MSARIKGLDGLRAIAVFLVFLHHNTGLAALDLGGYGVRLFFVLSGFLIIGILHTARERIEAGGSVADEWGGFAWRRSLRIFPAYYLVLAVAIPIALTVHHIDATGAAMLTTYTANIWIADVTGGWVRGFSHLWSLSIEEQFYLFAPALFLTVRARFHLHLAVVLVLVAMLADAVLVAVHATPLQIYTNSFINFGLIAFGGAAMLFLDGIKPAPGRSSALAATMLGAFLAAPLLATLGHAWSAIALPAVAILLVQTYLNQASWIVRLLEIAPLRQFGRISYGFYLYHNFLSVYQMAKVAGWLGMQTDPHNPVLVPISFMVSLGAAMASWLLIEHPISRLSASTARQRTPETQPRTAPAR